MKTQSNDIVLSSGREQHDILENNLYLHNFKGNYEAISDTFSRIDINLMNAIEKKILQKQIAEEQKIYDLLGVKGIDELNKLYTEVGGNSEFIGTTINEVISQASKDALTDLSGWTNKEKTSALANSVQNTLAEMIDENYKEDEEMAAALKKGLGEMVAKRMANLQKDKKKPRKMDKYINKVTKSLAASFRGEILETETGVVMARMMNQLIGSRGNVKLTATVRNSKGKQIKADNTLSIDETFEVGISDKNYLTDGKGNVEVSLHSSGSLENFYNLVNRMSINGDNGADLRAIQGLVEKFREPDFKYHLINQAAFAGVKNIKDTNVGQNIIDFIKKCLPLFIGAQFKIEGDNINVDFFNINGKLIPVSTIISDCLNGGQLTGQRIGLYSNYEVPWFEMLQKKLSAPVEEGKYYTDKAQEIGSFYGNQLYRQINVGTIHLKVALANIK